MNRLDQLAIIAKQKGYGQHKRHIFLCVAQGPCTDGENAEELWQYLKAKLKEREPDSSTATIARTKSGCLRICLQGPIALVYPEGTLYYDLDKTKLDRIIDEHLFNGSIVKDYTIPIEDKKAPPKEEP